MYIYVSIPCLHVYLCFYPMFTCISMFLSHAYMYIYVSIPCLHVYLCFYPMFTCISMFISHVYMYICLLYVKCKYSKLIGWFLVTWPSVMIHTDSKYHIDNSTIVMSYCTIVWQKCHSGATMGSYITIWHHNSSTMTHPGCRAGNGGKLLSGV